MLPYDMAINAQVFFRQRLAARRKARDGGARGGALLICPPRVRVDLGVEHEDVDVATRRKDVVQSTVNDVVRPPSPPTIHTVFFHKDVGDAQELLPPQSDDWLTSRSLRAIARVRAASGYLFVGLVGFQNASTSSGPTTLARVGSSSLAYSSRLSSVRRKP